MSVSLQLSGGCTMSFSLSFIILIVGPVLGTKFTSHITKYDGTKEHLKVPARKLETYEIENFTNGTLHAPRFKFPSKMFRMELKPAGSSIRLKCAAEGNPEPNITWSKNDVHGFDRQYSMPRYGKWSMELQELTKYDDGDYTCKVCNELGCIQHSTSLTVQERFPSKPYIQMGYPGNKSAFENESVKFECRVFSDLEPYVAWKWSQSNDSEQVILENGLSDKPEVLILDYIRSADQGWYECEASNSLGRNKARGYLKVKKKGEDVPTITPVFSFSYTTIMVISICASVVILLAIAVIIATMRKFKREKTKKQRAIEATIALMAEHWAKVIKVENNPDGDNSIHPIVTIDKVRYTDLSNDTNASSLPPEYIMPVDTKWEVLRENLILGSVLGKGEFGIVVKAEYSRTSHSRMPSAVAVKMLKADHSDEEMIALVSEMEIMKKIGKHENVVNLLGCCTQDGPLYVIVEYASNGCLREYLKKHKPNKMNNIAKDTKQLTKGDLVDFALQVAKGMDFLVSRGCIHRDLAARNVLVAARTLKVADFGLARDVRDSDYYRKHAPGKLPVRWMAPESLAHNYYTAYSDIWSFGVLAWEIMTFGCTPYQDISVHVLYQYLKSGQRLDKPVGCCQEIYSLMLHCWTFNSKDRPRFSDIIVYLQDILNVLQE